MKKEYEYLDRINFPSDLKKIPEIKLQKVADELREEMINAVKKQYPKANQSVIQKAKYESQKFECNQNS